MKGRFVLGLLLFSLSLSAQDNSGLSADILNLMRHGTAQEVDSFFSGYDSSLTVLDLDVCLYEAAFWNKDPQVAESLVRAGADPNRTQSFNRTPLMAAARHNNAAVVDKLLDLGADPSLQDRNGQTAVHFAAAFDVSGENIVALLLRDISCSVRDNAGRTPLELALSRSNYQGARHLIKISGSVELNTPLSTGRNLYSTVFLVDDPDERVLLTNLLFHEGASLKLLNNKGQTPLEEAESSGLNQIAHELNILQQNLQEELFRELQLFTDSDPSYTKVKRFLDRGADPLGLNRDSLTPCQLAVVGGYPKILILLMEYLDDRGPFESGLEKFNNNMPFFALSHSPETASLLMQILLDEGYSPDLIDPDGNPLITESLYSSLYITEMLLSAGADPNVTDRYGVTPLMRAGSLENGSEALELLIRYGADLYAKDDDGWGVLFYTVLFGGNRAAVQTLVDRGVDMNGRDGYGSGIILWAAAYNSDPSILAFLAEKGASLYSRDKDGWVPLMAALNWGNAPEVVEFLADHTRDGRIRDGAGRTLNAVIEKYREKTGQDVPGALASLNRRRVYPPDSIPYTDLDLSLHETAEWGQNPSMVHALVEAGANINSTDENGWTALMKASAYNSSSMTAAFLAEGADPLYFNDQGWSALHTASWSDSPDTMALLLDRGADATSKDRDGWTPLHWAARNQASFESLVQLVEAGAEKNALTDRGETPLFLMASGWVEPEARGIEFLLADGSDPDQANADGVTPLMKAAVLGYAKAVETLLDAGADPYREDSFGNDAVEYAESESLHYIINILRTR